jgi:F-type H+-transporting ATPase subunit delta
MFSAGRWASAFAAAAGASAEEGLDLLKVLIPALGHISGVVSGTAASLTMTRYLREGLTRAGIEAGNRGAFFALGTVALLIKRNRLSWGNPLIREIEKVLDERNGTLPATVETAFPLDQEFEHTLGELLKQKTGAREIRLTVAVVPELLSGCRLRMEGRSLDLSLRGQLQKMAADLQAAGGFSW